MNIEDRTKTYLFPSLNAFSFFLLLFCNLKLYYLQLMLVRFLVRMKVYGSLSNR